MSVELEDFHSAVAARQSAETDIKRMAGVITEAAQLLANWHKTKVWNIATCAYPMELTMEPGINADTWPTVAQLHEALTRWHDASYRASTAWQALPEHLRGVISAPPDGPT